MRNFDAEKTLRALTAMTSNLTPYLYESELFGELGSRLPKLTIGGLLLRLHQLRGLTHLLDSDQQDQLNTATINFESTRAEWTVHYEEKVLRELQSRLDALNWYLEDCNESPSSCAAGWPNEAEKRTVVAHLHDEAVRLDILTDKLTQKLSSTDSGIRRYFENGEFAWDEVLQTVYPREKFWWLYGSMSEEA
jgi:type IV secretory pathway VirB4 component